MNIKLRVSGLVPVVPQTVPMDHVAKQVLPLADRVHLLFPSPQIGAGYIQWSLPGNDWVSFKDADNETKSIVAGAYQERKEEMQRLLAKSAVKDAIFHVPADEYIYFRQNGSDLDIALVAWGYRSLEHAPGGELYTWVKRTVTQNVRIGFMWDGNPIPSFPFRLASLPRETGEDGYFCFDRPMTVGKTFAIETTGGKKWDLVVTEGQEDYLYDLTQRVHVDVRVLKDAVPLGNVHCVLRSDARSETLVTDPSGHASCDLPLVIGADGEVLDNQPACIVQCEGESQAQVPSPTDTLLRYDFIFETPVAPAPEPEPAPQPAPIPEQAPEPVPEPAPAPVVIKLLDYDGYPLPDMPFILKTKRGNMSLKTDYKGECEVSRNIFLPNEKMKVEFYVSEQYQMTHDIHHPKQKKQ